MNKLFTKIAAATLGVAMAIGVGVAVSHSGVAKEARADDTVDFTLSSASSIELEGITVSFAKDSGSTAPGWYDAGLRLYAKNTVTVSSDDKTIIGITFDWEKQGKKEFATVTADEGDYSHPTAAGEGVWEGSSNEIVFTLGSSGQLQLNTLHVTYQSSGPVTPSVSATGTSGPFYTSTSKITLGTKTNITPTSYAWEITSGDSYVTPGETNEANFEMTPVAAGTVSGTLTVSDGTSSPSCEWSITINEVAVSSISWTDMYSNNYFLTNTELNDDNMGTITATYNDGTQEALEIADVDVKARIKDSGDDFAKLTNNQFATAGTYDVRLYVGNVFANSKTFIVGNNTGTIAEAKALINQISGTSSIFYIGTFTTNIGVINQAANSSGMFYLGDEYNATSTSSSLQIYGPTSYGPAEAYGNLKKGAKVSVSGTLGRYGSSTPELKDYTILTYSCYDGLAVKTAPAKITYYEGEVFDPAGTVLTVSYVGADSRDITTGYTYTPTEQLIGTGNRDVTYTFIENGITKTCTQQITVVENPYQLTISNNELAMNTNSEDSSLTLTPAEIFGDDYVWEDVASTNESVAIASIGSDENNTITVISGTNGSATLTFEVYTSNLEHSASVDLSVTVSAATVTLANSSISADVGTGAKTTTATFANFGSAPSFSYTGGDNSKFTVAASDITTSGATITVTPVAKASQTSVTLRFATEGDAQVGTATLNVTVTDQRTIISLSGTDFTDFDGDTKLVPDNWTHSGAEKFSNTKTVFKGATNYLANELLVPQTSGDEIYAVIAQVYSVANNATKTNTMKVEALKDGTALATAGASTTFEPYNASVTSPSAVEDACTDENSKWALVYGIGMNGIKFSFETKNANWVVNEVRLFYLTKAEYDFAIALGDTAMKNICEDGKTRTTPSEALSSLWSSLETNYASLKNALGSYAYATEGTKKTNHILDIALIRYNYICDKYSTLSNFLERDIVPAEESRPVSASISMDRKDSAALIIVISASISLVALLGLIVLKKRKEQ